MELLEVELRAQRPLCLGARAVPGDVADLVTARLPDRGAIALDLALDARAIEAGRRDHVIDRFFAAPIQIVEPGVDHQSRGAKQIGLKVAGALDPLVGAELVGQLLGVERPALAIARVEAVAADHRQCLAQLRNAALQVMPGNALVKGQGRKRIFGPIGGRFQVDVVNRRARAVDAGGVVIAVRRALLDLDRDAAYFKLAVGDGDEGARQAGHHVGKADIETGDQRGAPGVVVGIELRGGLVERGQPRADGAGCKARRGEDAIELRADFGDLLDSERMDLGGGVSGGRRLGQRHRVNLGPARQAGGAVSGRGGGAEPLDHGKLTVERGIDLARDDRGRARRPVAGQLGLGGAGDKRGHQPVFARRGVAQ